MAWHGHGKWHSLIVTLCFYVISDIQNIAIYTRNLLSALLFTQKTIKNRKHHIKQKQFTGQC